MLNEVFEYPFTRLDPVAGDHLDPPSVAVYETLLTKGPDGLPRPGLATAWEVDESATQWRLRLRPGASFHSGDRCDAPTVVRALEQCRWGDGFARQIWYWDPVSHVSSEGDDVVVVTLEYPCPRLPVLLWGGHTAIANPEARRRDPAAFGLEVFDGTGPYRVARFSETEVVGELSETWSGAFARRLPPTIRWGAAATEVERQVALEDAEVDIVRAVDRAWIEQLDPDAWRFLEQPEPSQFYLALNFGDPRGFGGLHFRRAVEALLDREEIVASALGGHGHARRSPLPFVDEFASSYDDAAGPALTVDAAERLLDELGYARNDRGIRTYDGRELVIDCVVQDVEVSRRIASAVAAQLGRAGIVLAPRFVSVFGDFYRACEEAPPAFISKWLWGDGMEAIMGFSRSDCAADSGGNWQRATSSRLDVAYDRFLQATSSDELRVTSAAAQAIFVEELPYIPLCSPYETYAVRTRVGGYAPVPRTLYPAYDEVTRADDGVRR